MSLYDFKAYIRGVVQRSGLIRRSNVDHAASLLEKYDVNVVFDVGANNGQYGRNLISMGWEKRLVSFEPLSSAFTKLSANARPFPLWDVAQLGLGSRDGDAEINISGNSQSSSFREILDSHTDAAPQSAYIGSETVRMARLDSIVDDYCDANDRVFLKLDVQGFEKDVLQGAAASMQRVVGLQAEMAIKPLYDGETLYEDMVKYLDDLGYTMMTVAPVFADPRTGQVLQLEGTFYRQSEVHRLQNAA